MSAVTICSGIMKTYEGIPRTKISAHSNCGQATNMYMTMASRTAGERRGVSMVEVSMSTHNRSTETAEGHGKINEIIIGERMQCCMSLGRRSYPVNIACEMMHTR